MCHSHSPPPGPLKGSFKVRSVNPLFPGSDLKKRSAVDVWNGSSPGINANNSPSVKVPDGAGGGAFKGRTSVSFLRCRPFPSRPPPLTGHTGGGGPVAVPEQTQTEGAESALCALKMLHGCSDVTFVALKPTAASRGAEPQIIDQRNSWL